MRLSCRVVTMHMLIRALVLARSQEGALRTAKTAVFDRLVAGRVFDYYRTLDHEPGEHGIAGADRWGHDTPAAVRADTGDGAALIENGMAATEREFRRNLAAVKLALRHLSDEELREISHDDRSLADIVSDEERDAVAAEHDVERIPALFNPRYAMHRIGKYRGSPIWVYDGTDRSCGDGIRTRTQLQTIREHAEDADSELWVVPADVHF